MALDQAIWITDRDAMRLALDVPPAVCISDPNDPNEIRIRSASSDSADNFQIRTSAGYTRAGYTSTCTPAGF